MATLANFAYHKEKIAAKIYLVNLTITTLEKD